MNAFTVFFYAVLIVINAQLALFNYRLGNHKIAMANTFLCGVFLILAIAYALVKR